MIAAARKNIVRSTPSHRQTRTEVRSEGYSLIVYRRHLMKRLPLFAFVTVVASVVLLGWSLKLFTAVPSRADERRPLPRRPSEELVPTEKIDGGDEEPTTVSEQRAVLGPIEKIDWHDEEFMRAESRRTGIGEHGAAAFLPPDHDKRKYEEIFASNQYNGLLSDYISVNRSVPDTRPVGCQQKKYLRHLPDASIIIPIHDEHWSTLLRTIYSILNRSPPKLVREIIVVDDGSTKDFIKTPLDDYVAANLPKVRVLRIPAPRKGLMAARSLGASNAEGEVLIFADAHLEVNVNWLPPLLEPIAENSKACVCPVFDVIDYNTYEYKRYDGIRGVFDWEMRYQRLPLLKEDIQNPTRPYKAPVMLGALSAMTSRFFWELGGYDPELRIWGGEQYELSFKVWQCGGILVDAPCSKVAHMYRDKNPFKDPKIGDYVGRNHRRVAEVWMDEYAQYVYMRKPSWAKIDPGDLSERRELRERLKCKSFRWFMEEIAFDLTERYPPIEPPAYGSGRIMPLINHTLCLTVVNDQSIELRTCLSTPNYQFRQDYFLSWRKDIKIRGSRNCLDIYGADQGLPKAPVNTWYCQEDLGNQLWRYDLESQQFVFGRDSKLCLSRDAETNKVYAEPCDQTSRTQKWLIDSLNKDALLKWNITEPLVV